MTKTEKNPWAVNYALNDYTEGLMRVVIFEGRPLIFRCSHVMQANINKIGIVMIGDFSVRGEADLKILDLSSIFDRVDFFEVGEVPERMHVLLKKLISELIYNFQLIKTLGSHREFSYELVHNRTCPGIYGIKEVKKLRQIFKLEEPKL